VSECDREVKKMRRPWTSRGCCAMIKKTGEDPELTQSAALSATTHKSQRCDYECCPTT